MRKFTTLSFLLLSIVILSVSCTKEGPEGPVGAQGPQGPAGNTGAAGTPGAPGATGPAGTANVIYSNWFVQASGTWADSSTAWLGDISRSNKSVPNITQNIIDQGVVLAFISTEHNTTTNTSSSAYPLPFNVPNPIFFGETLQVGYIIAPGRLVFYLADLIFPDMAGFSLTTPFRYVIIPGGVAGGRMMNGVAKGKTVEELKRMSYQEVSALYHIPANGTNIPQ